MRDLGYLDAAEKAAAYAAATVVCQPSVNESFSIVLMEAWLAGTPVLVHARCAVTTHHVLRAGRRPRVRGLLRVRGARSTSSSRTPRGDAGSGAQGRAYVETEYAWPAVTARLHDTLERLVA